MNPVVDKLKMHESVELQQTGAIRTLIVMRVPDGILYILPMSTTYVPYTFPDELPEPLKPATPSKNL